MRHVTDGDLHAYLDGALDLLGKGRGDEVRQHLEVCPTCRERLQDEEGIRDQARELLGLTAPEEGSLPSFEELRARAEASEASGAEEKAPGHYRGPLRGLPLAWAATVVLSLGVGWMGGEIWRSAPSDALGIGEAPNPSLQPASALDASPEAEPGAPTRGRLESEAESPADLSYESAEVAAVGGLVGGETQGRGDVETATQLPGARPLVSEAPKRVEEAEELREEGQSRELPVSEARRDEAILVPAEALLSPSAPTFGQNEIPSLLLGSRTVAGESSLAVPGLTVLTVEWEEWTPGERSLHIRQLLPLGDTLELRYLGLLMGSEPDVSDSPVVGGRGVEEGAMERPLSPKFLEVSLPTGWNQVVMRRSRGWLVARAPLPEESLRALLRSLF